MERAPKTGLATSPEPQIASKKDDGTACDKQAGTFAKCVALLLLLAHNVVIVIMMRDSQHTAVGGAASAKKIPYLATSAVFMAEVFKMMSAFALVAWEERSVLQAVRVSYGACTADSREMLKLSVPSILYAVQNNLLFIALAHLPAAVYAVSYQLKILTTAVFSGIILGRKLSIEQWISLIMLTYGVALMQSGYRRGISGLVDNATWVGFIAVLCACFTSSFAGVYMEKLLKSTATSLWLRNVQLAAIGSPVTFAAVLWYDGDRVREGGLLQGFDATVWAIVFINALGGLVIAAVLRYADNIMKCFASAAGIVFVCLISSLQGDYMFDNSKIIGTCCVVFASLLYSLGQPAWTIRFFQFTSDVSFGVIGFVSTAITFTLLWSSLPATHYSTMVQPASALNFTSPFLSGHQVREALRLKGNFLFPSHGGHVLGH
jgi:UDP-sugar transporter A1/2/3